MKTRLARYSLALAIITTALWLAACKKDKTDPDINALVYAPSAQPYGQSYTEWTVDWMQAFMGFDCANNPWLNPAGVLFHQTGPVYFMAGLSTPGASVNITVPQGKAILFPLFNYINDYPCPDSSWHPAPGQSLVDFLTPGAVDPMGLAKNLSVTIDGASVSNLPDYLFTTGLFTFTGDPSLALPACSFDPCVTGSPQSAVSSGYYLMLKPLAKGAHTVHYHVDVPTWNAVQDGTYNITIP